MPSDQSPRVRRLLEAEFASEDPRVREELVRLLGKDAIPNRRACAVALGGIGPEATEAVPALIMALKFPFDARLRVDAATGLGGIGPAAKDAIPALEAARSDESVGRDAAWALKQIRQ